MSLGTVETPEVEKRPFNINDVDTSSNQENIVVPYFAGVAKCAVDWVAPLYNLTSKKVDSGNDSKGKGGGGGGGQTHHFADIAGITNVCADDAPNDAILYILVNDEIALTGPITRAPGTHYAAFSVPKFSQSCRFYWGTSDQPIDTLVLSPRQTSTPGGVNPRDVSTWPRLDASGEPVGDAPVPGVANPRAGHYDLHPAYRNQGLFVAKQWFLGNSPNVQSIVIILARGTKFFATRFEASERGVNPMGPAYELLADPMFGAGFTEGNLVQAKFEETAAALTTADIELAPALRSATSARSFWADYFQYFDGFFRRTGGSIELGYFTHGDIDVDALPAVGSEELLELPSIKPGDLADTKNAFFVTYTNRAKWYKDDDTDRFIDQANFLKVGVQRDDRLTRPHIIDGELAVRHGVEWGKIFATELATGKISCRRDRADALGLRVGKRFKSNVSSLSLAFVWRIMEAERPTDRDGAVKFALEAERGIWPTLFIPPSAPKPPDFVIVADAIDNARLVELPSGLKTSSAIQLQALCERPNSDILGAKVHVSTDDDLFTLAATIHHFASFGKIAVAYTAATSDLDTTVGMIVDLLGVDLGQVVSQIDSERDDNRLLVWVDNEIMSVGAVTALGNGRFKIFLRRALYGTAKANHLVDHACWFLFRHWIEPIEHQTFEAGATRYFKLVPFIYGGDYDIGLVDSIPFVFAGGAVSAIFNLELTTTARVAAGRVESRIAATWNFATDQDIFAFEVAIKRSDAATWQFRTVNTNSTDWEVAPSTSYDVKVRPVNSHGEPGAWSAVATIVSASISPFSVTGLELVGQGNDTECRERDFKFACRLNSPSSGVNVGGVIQTGVQDPAFAYLLWQVFVGGALVYQEQTTAPHFEFTYSKNETAARIAGAAGPFAEITLNVYAVDSLHNVSTPAIGTFANLAPVAPTSLAALAANNRTIFLGWTNGPETDLDEVWIYRHTANDSGGATRIARISARNNVFVDSIPDVTGSVAFYYWLKAVDTFGNLSAFSAEAHATSDPLAASIADVDDFEIGATKLSLKIVILRGDNWVDGATYDVPPGTWIAWNAHQILYGGVAYPIAASDTQDKYVYWNIGDASYTTSNTPLDLAGGRFLIAQNRAGTHVEAWNSFANTVIGFANIGLAEIRSANILNLVVDKLLGGTILGKNFILRNDGATPGALTTYDYVPGVAGAFFGMDATGQSFLEVFRGLIRCALAVGGVFNVAANGFVTIGPLSIGTDGSFKINAGPHSFNVDPDGKWWIGATNFVDAPLRSDNAGNALANSLTLNNPIVFRLHPPPTFTNDFDNSELTDRSYNDTDDISVRAHGVAGKRIRFTVDGSEVTPNSPFWPNYPAATAPGSGPNDFVGFVLGLSGFTGIFRARVADGPAWEFLGEEGTVRLTHTPIDLLPLPVAPPPHIYFSSGTRSLAGYKVKIAPGVPGASILYSTDEGASYSGYTPGSELTVGADASVMAYNVKDGYAPSAVAVFYNTTRDVNDPGWNGPPGTFAP